MKLQPVILAGGNGYRLWPLSQKSLPKQFIKQFGKLSTFQLTVLRNRYLGKPLILANINHKEIIAEQLLEIGETEGGAIVIFEPEAKNTAICALVASYYSKKQGFDTVAIFPSDHNIEEQDEYVCSLSKAIEATTKYKFCTIGINPAYANSNFGYIKTDSRLSESLYMASKFTEKPSKELAKNFIKNPGYFWNSGIYIFDINHVLGLSEKFIPEIQKLIKYMSDNLECSSLFTLDEEIYKKLPSISFDHAISANLDEIPVINASFKWQDLGNWEDIWNFDIKDENQNNIQGEVLLHKVNNSCIYSYAKTTVAIDLEDIIVIFKNGHLLVANKNSTELIKQIVPKFV